MTTSSTDIAIALLGGSIATLMVQNVWAIHRSNSQTTRSEKVVVLRKFVIVAVMVAIGFGLAMLQG